MSHTLGEVGNLGVSSFCGPAGRRESYQLTGPDDRNAFVVFTWDEFCTISDLIFKAHDGRGGRELGKPGPVWDGMTDKERACFARGLLSGLHTAANAFLGSTTEVEAFMEELKGKIMKEHPDA
jgi:hypothetical protein